MTDPAENLAGFLLEIYGETGFLKLIDQGTVAKMLENSMCDYNKAMAHAKRIAAEGAKELEELRKLPF